MATTREIKRTKITNPFYPQAVRDGVHIIGGAGYKAGRHRVTNPRANQSNRFHPRPGRPPRETAGAISPTVVRSIRLPPDVWDDVEKQAAREGKNRHAALREAVLMWLQS